MLQESTNWKFMLQESTNWKFMLQESTNWKFMLQKTTQTGSLCYKKETFSIRNGITMCVSRIHMHIL